MPAPFLIVGQGVAGTLLAWEFERAGFDFEIADSGHGDAASMVAAGIVNPITGRRFVKSWKVDTLLGPARARYRELEQELGVPLVREMRVWRMFARPGDRDVVAAKAASLEWASWVNPAGVTDQGFWIESALHVDLPTLLLASRARWERQGRLQTRRVRLADERAHRDCVILCLGAGALGQDTPVVPLERAKGEVLRVVAAQPMASDVIRNLGAWLLPLTERNALVGATYNRDASDLAPSARARVDLEQHAGRLLDDRAFEVEGHLTGWRVTVPDRRPVVGRFPGARGVGVINGLGSKGALYAPWLARQWVNHLSEGVPFEPEVEVGRWFAT